MSLEWSELAACYHISKTLYCNIALLRIFNSILLDIRLMGSSCSGYWPMSLLYILLFLHISSVIIHRDDRIVCNMALQLQADMQVEPLTSPRDESALY